MKQKTEENEQLLTDLEEKQKKCSRLVSAHEDYRTSAQYFVFISFTLVNLIVDLDFCQ